MKKAKTETPNTAGLDLFGAKGIALTPDAVWKMYERGMLFNSNINLNETVRVNENFFIGKQWEGVISNGLPTPVFNILKRVALFTVASITSDNIKVNATPLAATPATEELATPVRIVNEELDSLTEHLNISSLMREYARNAAVDGDGCTYTYWDPDAETGQQAKGKIVTEILENTQVFFGNPNDRLVQNQPYILISKREIVGHTKRKAKANGIETWDLIQPDSSDTYVDDVKQTDDKVTVLLLLWRDEETGHICGCESTRTSLVREAWDLKLSRYPITWLNWDYVQDCYHGQAMITGLIPNQIFINKTYAMSMLSLMTTAFPKVVYDKTRVSKWDNRIGAAIGINGGDVNNVARIIDPATISPQISQFIELAVNQTEESLGATSVALGDTRPDNTSAIIALQRAASTPSELTKQNLYKSIEDLYRIYIDFMGAYYGKRFVDVDTPQQVEQAFQFVGQQPPPEVPLPFDFSMLKKIPMAMRLDVGASSYYSEIASIQTLDNLLKMGRISTTQYLERIPDGYIPARRELVQEMKQQEAAQMQAQQAMQGAQDPGNASVAASEEKPDIPTGGGYSALQRKVNATGTTEGMV